MIIAKYNIDGIIYIIHICDSKLGSFYSIDIYDKYTAHKITFDNYIDCLEFILCAYDF